MPQIKVNQKADLIASRQAVIIRGEDGTMLAMSPALAAQLARDLPVMIEHARHIFENPPRQLLPALGRPPFTVQ